MKKLQLSKSGLSPIETPITSTRTTRHPSIKSTFNKNKLQWSLFKQKMEIAQNDNQTPKDGQRFLNVVLQTKRQKSTRSLLKPSVNSTREIPIKPKPFQETKQYKRSLQIKQYSKAHFRAFSQMADHLSQPQIFSLSKSKYLQKKAHNQSYQEEDSKQSIFNNLSKEYVKEEEKEHIYVGEKAVKTFYDHYKNLDKINQQNENFQLIECQMTSLLQSSNSKNLLPRKLGVVKSSGNPNELQLKSYKLSKGYVDVISENLSKLNDIKKLDLSQNNFSPRITNQLLNEIQKMKKGESINFADNNIGLLGCQKIAEICQDKKCKIIQLNLENTQIGYKCVQIILNALHRNNSLKILDLSKNLISDNACPLFKQFLKSRNELDELYLHWNQITGKGGCSIIEGLLQNNELKVIDLSWNKLGQYMPCALLIYQLLTKKLSQILHWDLSYNNFSYQEAEKISQGLQGNTHLYGFHFEGNYGYVNQLGYITLVEEKEEIYFQKFKRINGLDVVNQMKCKDICWICLGWQEVTFKWKFENIEDLQESEELYVHIENEGFQGLQMMKDDNNNFILKRICPPGKCYYFFTKKHKKQYYHFFSPNHENEKYQYEIHKNIKVGTNKIGEIIQDRLNYVIIKQKKVKIRQIYVIQLFLNNNYVPDLQSKPRTKIMKLTLPNLKIPWALEKSEMKKYHHKKVDEQAILDYKQSNFVSNFQNSKIVQKLQKNIRRYYQGIIDYYIQLQIIQQNISVMPLQNLYDSLVEQEIITQKKKILFQKVSCRIFQNDDLNKYIHMKLRRIQFLDFLLYLSQELFGQEFEKPSQAFKHLIQRLIFLQQPNNNLWRDQRFFNFYCDRVIKKYYIVLQWIFQQNSTDDFMNYLQYKQVFLQLANSEQIDEIIIKQSYLKSKQIPVLIFNNLNILQNSKPLDFHEFVEALARFSDNIPCSPIGYDKKVSNWTKESIDNIPLCIKLESLLIQVLQFCSDQIIENIGGIPNNSMFKYNIEEVLAHVSD